MIGFFLLRRLVELGKVSSTTSDRMLSVYAYEAFWKNVSRINGPDLWELYDMGKEVPKQKSPVYMANQFFHAYTSFVSRDESRNWKDVYIVSDFDRNKHIWRVPIQEIRNLFLAAAKDYPTTVTWTYDPKHGDYEVSTN